MSQQGQEPNDANASSQASTAQIEPRATISVAATTSAVATTSAAATASAAVGASPAAQDIVQSTHQSTRIEAQSRSKSEPTLSDTALEACLNGVFTTLIARGELEAEHTHKIPDPPTVEQVTALLADASFSVPDARLIVADRVTFGVLQQPRNVDFVIKLPPSRRSTMMEVVCQIIFDPGSDNCLLRNWTYRPVNLTYLNSPPSTCGRACVGYKHSHVIQPGLWRISMYADEDRVAERHLIEFLLLGRQLTVAIRKAIDAPSAKRAADDDYGEHKDKRQRLEDNTAETITTLYKQNPSGVGLVPANINADNVDTNDHYLTKSSHIQEIINNPGSNFYSSKNTTQQLYGPRKLVVPLLTQNLR
ncbi:hypothetical protein TrVFT333_007437 [Trichoderma virens FT-333]|nr:hypothetical protein TrVFT333_007437 [Trichoderma virens FT-333]